jgi:hypothetical protein
MVEYYALMYENGKMRPAETVPRMGRRGIKKNGGGVNSTVIYCKNFCKCHIASPAQYDNNFFKRLGILTELSILLDGRSKTCTSNTGA